MPCTFDTMKVTRIMIVAEADDGRVMVYSPTPDSTIDNALGVSLGMPADGLWHDAATARTMIHAIAERQA